jgi:hypothetical protein
MTMPRQAHDDDYAYDPTGAMSGLFAPAYIHGDPVAEAAAAAWNAAHLKTPPAADVYKPPTTTTGSSRDAITAALIAQALQGSSLSGFYGGGGGPGGDSGTRHAWHQHAW